MVYAYDSFTGVSLKAEYTVPTTTTTSSTFSITTQIAPAALAPPHASGSTKLTINVPKVGIAMTKGQSLHFRLTVTSLPELFIVTSAMNGDVDLYVKRGGLASRSRFDKKSLTSSSDESVQFTAPKPGRNFVYRHVLFSAIVRLDQDLLVMRMEETELLCESHHLTLRHWPYSHLPRVGSKSGQWRKTASTHRPLNLPFYM